MTFIARVQLNEPNECWCNLLASSYQRFAESNKLRVSGSTSLGALYLAGYSGELALKIAYYKLAKLDGLVPVSGRFAVASKWLKKNAPLHGGASFTHAADGWLNLIEAERSVLGIALWDPAFHAALRSHVTVIARNWSESLRYRHTIPHKDEVLGVALSSEWLLQNINRIAR